MILNSPYISGSLTVTSNGTVSGSLTVLGGITGAITGSATSASYAISASEASNLQGLGSASFAPASTFNTVSQSYAASSASLSTRVTNLETTSSTVSSSFATTSGSIAGRVTLIEGQYATTGSNNFTKPQQISDVSNAISFTSTASLYTDGGLRVKGSSFISGTAYFNDVVVYGTSSIEYITSSQLAIGTNIITLNTDTPSIRFGGISVFDSGSNNLSTGSLFWDSEKDKWIYSNPSASTYDGGIFISGPRNSNSLGNEVDTTSCALMMGQGGDHITSSAIFSYGNATCFYGASAITSTGVGCFSGAVCASNITSTGTICSTGNTCFGGTVILAGNVGIGTASPTVKLHVSGSGTTYGKIEGVGNNTTGLLTQNSNKQYFAGTYYNVVDAWEVADITANGCTRLTITSTGIACFACQVCTPILHATTNAQIGYGGVPAGTGKLFISRGDQYGLNINVQSGYARIQGDDDLLAINRGGVDILSMSTCNHLGVRTTASPWAALRVCQCTSNNDYAVRVQAVFGINDYLDSDANRIFGGGLSETQFLNGSPSRPAMISLGGNLATSEALGVINFFRSDNASTYRSRAQIWAATNGSGCSTTLGGYITLTTADTGQTNPTQKLTIFSNGIACFACSVCSPRFQADNYGIFRASAFRGGLFTYDGVSGAGTDYSPTIFAEGGAGGGNFYIATGGSATVNMAMFCSGITCFRCQVCAPSGVKFGNGSGTLNYYEEGTFSPRFCSAGLSNITYGSGQIGYYTRIGRLVFISVNLMTESLTSSGTNQAVTIRCLPFTSANLNESTVGLTITDNSRYDNTPPVNATITPNTNTISLFVNLGNTGAGTDPTPLYNQSFSPGAGNRNITRLSGVYITS